MYLHTPTLYRILRRTFSPGHARLRHIAAVAWMMPALWLVRTIVWVARGVDRVFYPDYKQQSVDRPLFIIGNPRSGTTFLHRLLSLDAQFTSTKLVHTLFPSVGFYRLFEALGRLDPHLGRPMARLVRWIDRKGFSGWQGIHRTRLGEPEEDEQYFVYTMLSPVVTLLFPYFEILRDPCFVDDLPGEVQDKLMAYYRDCLQRHLYARGRDKTLLTKNTMLSGRLQATRDVLPDLRVVHIVRHPYDAIPSLLSMYEVPWNRFAPQTRKDGSAYRALASLFADYYRRRLRMRRAWTPGQFVEVRFDDLVADPEGVVGCIYQRLGLPLSDPFRAALHAEAQKAKGYRSTHAYSLEAYGLTRDFIYEQMPDVFTAYGFER